jgi:ABC-type lipoprotein release transport system permease subunit
MATVATTARVTLPDRTTGLEYWQRAARVMLTGWRSFRRLVGTLFAIGFSLLPLSVLLLALPAVSPNEAVLTETVPPARSRWQRLGRRLFALVTASAMFIVLLAFALEVVSHLPTPPGNQLGIVAKKILSYSVADFVPDDAPPPDLPPGKVWLTAGELLERQAILRKAASRQNLGPIEKREAEERLAEVEAEIESRLPRSARLRVMLDPQLAPILAVPLWRLLPRTLVEQWPFVLLTMYATDFLLLLLIGRVPLAYNFRYLWVRKRDTLLTSFAFTVVVALVIILLAFVNGMYKLNESTGVPGNVLVLSEGSTDELFSNMARGDADNVERVVITADPFGRPIGPVGVARAIILPDGSLQRLPPDAPADLPGAVYLASREAYLVLNQAIPTRPGEMPRRRFLQMRGFQDVRIGAMVHNIELEPGGQWFTSNAIDPGPPAPDGRQYLQCTLGQGAAAILGEDVGKKRLEVGDTFEVGDRYWKVVGIMKTGGTAYGSEIWTGSDNPVVRSSGKGDKFTTLVLRMADDSPESAKAMAWYLNEVYEQAKLKAFAEPDYYRELTRTNEQFLSAIILVAIIMAVGGVFGVMNTMFASIAARIKEVGVLRILGFKRWQILISFMIESLTIAVVGGSLGCCLGLLADGWEATSTLSGGQGGGKSVTLTMIVDSGIVAAGFLFTLIMGRLGGLVPALSAMRLNILESLR